jgi:P4 family phage/plasmid primase-like protien
MLNNNEIASSHPGPVIEDCVLPFSEEQISSNQRIKPFDPEKTAQYLHALLAEHNQNNDEAGSEGQINSRYSESNLAISFAATEAAQDFRDVKEQNKWLQFNGMVWKPEKTFLKEIRKHVDRQLQSVPEDKKDPNYITKPQQMNLQRSSFQKGIKAQLGSMEQFIIEFEDLNTHDNQLNTKDGVVFLDDPELKLESHQDTDTRQYLHTKIAGTVPINDEDMTKCPKYKKLLNYMVSGRLDLLIDAPGLDGLSEKELELRDFIEARLGADLWGDKYDKTCPIFIGEKDNGKSILAEVLLALFGDYAGRIAKKVLLSGSKSTHEKSELADYKLLITEELDDKDEIDNGTLKDITGSEAFSARPNYCSSINVRRTFSIVIMTNRMPELKKPDEALLRRLCIIPLAHSVPENLQDKNLGKDIIANELPYVLYRLIKAGQKYRQGKYKDNLPEQVVLANQRYKNISDELSCIAETTSKYCIELKTHSDWAITRVEERVKLKDFVDLCRKVAEANGDQISANNVRGYLKQRELYKGYEASRSNGTTWVTGLKWNPNSSCEVDLRNYRQGQDINRSF